MRKPHYSGPWRTIRRQVLERDQHICRIGAPGCTLVANQVDHIVPVSRGGAWWDLANLRAACPRCNNGRNAIASKASRTW